MLFVFALLFFVFSYLWVDFGLVLMLAHTRPVINNFNLLRDFGNKNRELLAVAFVFFVISCFSLQILILLRKKAKIWNKKLLIGLGVAILLFSLSYPFLSHDSFTYLFSAKMVWQYRVNPYLVSPKEFVNSDLWVSFVHNIDNTYAYGPVYLIYSLIPMLLLSGSRFIANFYGAKLMNAVVFSLCGFLLLKMGQSKRKVLSLWFFNPLLIIELLANSHNELTMIFFFFVAIYFLSSGNKKAFRKNTIYSLLFFLMSVGIKYVSIIAAPILFIKKRYRGLFLKFLSLALILFLQFTTRTVQPWYYAWLYMFLPLVDLTNLSLIALYIINVLILIEGYYLFIKIGLWGDNPLIPNFQIWLYVLLLIIFLEEVGFLGRLRLALRDRLKLKRLINKRL